MTPEELEPRPFTKFFETVETILGRLGEYWKHGDPNRHDDSIQGDEQQRQANQSRKEAMDLVPELERLIPLCTRFAKLRNLDAEVTNRLLRDCRESILSFGDWHWFQKRDEYDHYYDTYEWHGPDFGDLSHGIRDLKLEPILIDLLDAESATSIPQAVSSTPQNPVGPSPTGVTLLDAALVLQGLNRDGQRDDEKRKAAVEMKRRWEKSRPFGRSLPTSIGFDPNDSQAYLYATAALCDCVVKQEAMLVTQFGGQKKLVAELGKIAREPLPAE